jgi:NAD(P)-dependent dehydrogenase (short-subunit alcohol dehydrogenase family)
MQNEEWGLVGKVAIITGGGAANDGIGNGRAAAILLARAGANVLAVDRDLTLAERSVEMIAAEGGNAVAASYDVTSSAQCAAMVKEVVSRWGRLDCLDNNVGISSKGTVLDETEETWTHCDSRERGQPVPGLQADSDRRRRSDRQYFFNLGAAPARPHDLYCLQGRGYRADQGNCGRSRRWHPRKLCRAGDRCIRPWSMPEA